MESVLYIYISTQDQKINNMYIVTYPCIVTEPISSKTLQKTCVVRLGLVTESNASVK